MRYTVSGNTPGVGGWSMNIEAPTPQDALAEAMRLESADSRYVQAAEIRVFPELPPLPQTKGYEGCLMSCSPPLLTVTRGNHHSFPVFF